MILCLNMIVKNESKILTRLFDSVLPIIDTYCICDTGSTDDTPNIIKNYFDSKNIQGKLIFEPFKDFSYNRNFALKECLGMSDYILLLDADMVLQIPDNFDKLSIQKYDAIFLYQGDENFYNHNLRIIKNDPNFEYKCVTHEYINVGIQDPKKNYSEDLFILDLGDGGCKSDKYERDIRLLLQGIKDEPENVPRYTFYLANSYFCIGDYKNAIKYYKRRLELDSWYQEIWYSYYRLGLSYYALNRVDKAINSWLNAYQIYPNRIENLYELVKHYRIISNHKLCNIFYEIAKCKIPDVKHNEILFHQNDVYTYKLFYEFTVFASYLGIQNINNEVVEVLNNCNDQNVVNNLLSNFKFYDNILQKSSSLDFSSSIINDNVTFNSSSSCLIRSPDRCGYIMNMRYVNYHITENGSYINCDDHIMTINVYYKLDNNFNVIESKQFNLEFDGRKYIGVEDVRIIETNGCETSVNETSVNETNNDNNVIFMGTGLHKNGNLGIVYGKYDIQINKLEYKELTFPDHQQTCEKNWVFFKYNENNENNNAKIIYNWFPLTVCDIDYDKNELVLNRTIEMPKIFKHVRGSSSGFNYNDEIWFVCHIVSYESPRHYYHIFVVFDNEMKLKKYSAPFKFDNVPIQYCLSLIVTDENVVCNVSLWDRTTYIIQYDKKYIDGRCAAR